MTVVPFLRVARVPPKPARFRVELAKGKHRRLFEIIPNVGNGRWQSWMRFDGKPLRAETTDDPILVRAIREEYEREIAALKADGWT